MASHHDHHGHSNEKKPVSFTVPIILAAVTWLVMIALVSLGDPCHCDEMCATECKEAHGGHGGHGHDAAGHGGHDAEEAGKDVNAAEHAKSQESATTKEEPAAQEGEGHH